MREEPTAALRGRWIFDMSPCSSLIAMNPATDRDEVCRGREAADVGQSEGVTVGRSDCVPV